MPPVFKALATITAWVLFINFWVSGLSTLVMGIVNGQLFGAELPPMSIYVGFALSIASGVLAVVVMRLRQKME